MAFRVGSKIVLRNGKQAEIVAAFGTAEVREYKVRCGSDTIHYTGDELLGELAASRSGNTHRFDMSVSGSQRR
jgi:hypothetical protein